MNKIYAPIAAVAVGILVLGALDSAMGVPNAVNTAPINYDCDVPAGHFSSVDTEISLPVEVSGTITPLVLRSGEFLPVGNVSIQSRDKWGVGLKVLAFNASQKSLVAAYADYTAPDHLVAMAKVDKSQSISFRLAISELGEGSLRVDQSEHAFKVDLEDPLMLRFSCSTGQFKFKQLHWGPPAE
jgi:hypothetical protein